MPNVLASRQPFTTRRRILEKIAEGSGLPRGEGGGGHTDCHDHSMYDGKSPKDANPILGARGYIHPHVAHCVSTTPLPPSCQGSSSRLWNTKFGVLRNIARRTHPAPRKKRSRSKQTPPTPRRNPGDPSQLRMYVGTPFTPHPIHTRPIISLIRELATGG